MTDPRKLSRILLAKVLFPLQVAPEMPMTSHCLILVLLDIVSEIFRANDVDYTTDTYRLSHITWVLAVCVLRIVMITQLFANIVLNFPLKFVIPSSLIYIETNMASHGIK